MPPVKLFPELGRMDYINKDIDNAEYAPLYSFIYDNDFEKARSIWSNRSENSAEDLMFIQI